MKKHQALPKPVFVEAELQGWRRSLTVIERGARILSARRLVRRGLDDTPYIDGIVIGWDETGYEPEPFRVNVTVEDASGTQHECMHYYCTPLHEL